MLSQMLHVRGVEKLTKINNKIFSANTPLSFVSSPSPFHVSSSASQIPCSFLSSVLPSPFLNVHSSHRAMPSLSNSSTRGDLEFLKNSFKRRFLSGSLSSCMALLSILRTSLRLVCATSATCATVLNCPSKRPNLRFVGCKAKENKKKKKR